MNGTSIISTCQTPYSEESQTHTHINDLPDELLLEIFSKLELETLERSSLTNLICKRWNALSFDPYVIKNLFFTSLPQTAQLFQKENAHTKADYDFFLRSLKSDACMRPAKTHPPQSKYRNV